MKSCVFCEKPIEREPYYQLVTAWVASGKRDSVCLRKDVEPPAFACRSCIRLQQDGVPAAQGSLV